MADSLLHVSRSGTLYLHSEAELLFGSLLCRIEHVQVLYSDQNMKSYRGMSMVL
jgi:hypothetical protein